MEELGSFKIVICMNLNPLTLESPQNLRFIDMIKLRTRLSTRAILRVRYTIISLYIGFIIII